PRQNAHGGLRANARRCLTQGLSPTGDSRSPHAGNLQRDDLAMVRGEAVAAAMLGPGVHEWPSAAWPRSQARRLDAGPIQVSAVMTDVTGRKPAVPLRILQGSARGGVAAAASFVAAAELRPGPASRPRQA